MNETVIIGGGPSALSAALYLGRFERNVTLVCDSFGGQAAIAGELENYPGYKTISGAELIAKMVEQIKALPTVKIVTGERVGKIEKIESGIKVTTDKNSYEGKSALIATGRSARKLGIEGEDQLIGKGLSYCAVCDGPFARGKEVVIIGGGYAATEAALILEKLAAKITILSLTEELSGETIVIDKVKQNKKIEIIPNAQTNDIVLENGVITKVKYQDKKTNTQKEVGANFVFVEIGQIPNSKDFSELLKINEQREIIVDHKTKMTSIDGIFASGDVSSDSTKQVIAAAADGAKAAISINTYLQSN